MIAAWWLLPAALVGAVVGVVVSYADEITQWMRRGGGLSGGR